ncbi:hypothetical protein JNW89_34905, partial [Micromonospora sp. 4G55]|nr:hypothetical protein [Micromonospora sp. 4G55]
MRDRLPAVPAGATAEVARELDLLDRELAEANRRLAASAGRGDATSVDNAILGPLRARRVAALDRIAVAVARGGGDRPSGLVSMADCELSFDGAHAGHGGHETTGSGGPATTPTPGAVTGGAATPTVDCPSVRDRLPGIPTSALDEVNRNLTLLDTQLAEANERLVTRRVRAERRSWTTPSWPPCGLGASPPSTGSP